MAGSTKSSSSTWIRPWADTSNLNDNLQVYGHGGGGPGVHAIAAWRSDGFGFFWVSNKDPLVDDFDDLLEIDGWPAHDLWQSVGISRDPVGSAPVESWVPAVAHTAGVGDSIWRSDVGLLNRSTANQRRPPPVLQRLGCQSSASSSWRPENRG